MKETTQDLYTYKVINRKIGGKGDNLFKLGEWFGVKDNVINNKGFQTEGDLVIGSLSYNMFHHIVNIFSTKYRIEGLPSHLKVKDFWKYFISGQMIFFKKEIEKGGKKVLMFSQYSPIEYDIFFNPIKVAPIVPNETGENVPIEFVKELDYTKNEFVEVLFNPQRKSLILMIGRLLSDLQFFYDEMKYENVITRPFIFLNGLSQDDLTAEKLNELISNRQFFKLLTQQYDTSNDEEMNKLHSALTNELNQKLEVLQGKSRMQDIIVPSIDIITNYLFEILSLNRNDNKDKKERMIVDEVNINNETKRFATTTIIDMMQESFDEINSVFGEKLRVIDTEQELDDESDKEQEEVKEDDNE